MTALYSVNLHIMGKSNVPLMSERTLASMADSAAQRSFGAERLHIVGWEVSTRDAGVLVLSLLVAAVAVGALLYLFFRTNLGTAMQAAGDNAQMIRALGVNVDNMIVLGLALSNGLIALSGGAARAVPGICRRADGHRHGRLGPGEHHHRRGARRRPRARVRDHRRGRWARSCSACSWRSRCAAGSTRTT